MAELLHGAASTCKTRGCQATHINEIEAELKETKEQLAAMRFWADPLRRQLATVTTERDEIAKKIVAYFDCGLKIGAINALKRRARSIVANK